MRLVLTVCKGVRDVQVDTESDTVTVFSSSLPSQVGGASARGGETSTGSNGGDGSRPDTLELLRHLDDLGLGLTFVVATDKVVSTAAGDGAVAAATPSTTTGVPASATKAAAAVMGGENATTPAGARRFKEEPATTTQTTMVIVLAVEGMMCQNNCGSTVRGALSSVPEVLRADVSYAKRRATVWAESSVEGPVAGGGRVVSGAGTVAPTFSSLLDALIGAVEAVGFGATVVHDVVLEVEGMMCQRNCGSTIKAALEAVRGVRRAEVSFADGRALVWGSGGCGFGEGSGGGGRGSAGPVSAEEVLVDAVEGVGFGAAVAPAVVLEVEGMMCQKNCGTTVRQALEGVSEVARAEVSFRDKLAKVWGSGSDCGAGVLSVGTLVDAVVAVGFDASPASSGTPPPSVSGRRSNEKMLAMTDAAGLPSSSRGKGQASSGDGGRKNKGSGGGGSSRVVSSMSVGALQKGGLSSGAQGVADNGGRGGGGGRLALSTGSFTVEGMSCAACVGKVERFVGAMRGVGDVRVALLAGQVRQFN